MGREGSEKRGCSGGANEPIRETLGVTFFITFMEPLDSPLTFS